MKPNASDGRYDMKFGMAIKSLVAIAPAANMIGIDMRKLNRAASFRSKPRHKPPLMVAADRETPGNNANACEQPMISASTQVIESILRSRLPIYSTRKIRSAATKRIVAMMTGC